MRLAGPVTFAAFVLTSGGPVAAASRSPPAFPGSASPPSLLRIWGPPSMTALLAGWSIGFDRVQPGTRVAYRLLGSDTAVPGLYSGLADIALLGRHDDVTDDNGFSRPKAYAFRRFRLMNGSLDTEGASPALAILVHRGNPIARLTLAQLASIVACSCKGGAKPSRTWGDLGVTGAWAPKRIHFYTVNIESGTGRFFLHVVLNDGQNLDWERVRQFRDRRRGAEAIDPASSRTAAAVRADPDGIAVSTLRYAGTDLKPVAIAVGAAGPFVLPSRASIIAGTYPFARRPYALVDQPPGQPLDAKVLAFLRYALSAAGQAEVQSAGGVPAARRRRGERTAADPPVTANRGAHRGAASSDQKTRIAATKSSPGLVNVIPALLKWRYVNSSASA